MTVSSVKLQKMMRFSNFREEEALYMSWTRLPVELIAIVGEYVKPEIVVRKAIVRPSFMKGTHASVLPVTAIVTDGRSISVNTEKNSVHIGDDAPGTISINGYAFESRFERLFVSTIKRKKATYVLFSGISGRRNELELFELEGTTVMKRRMFTPCEANTLGEYASGVMYSIKSGVIWIHFDASKEWPKDEVLGLQLD